MIQHTFIIIMLFFTVPTFGANLVVINPAASSPQIQIPCADQIAELGSDSLHDLKLPAYCYQVQPLVTLQELDKELKAVDIKLDKQREHLQNLLLKDSQQKNALIRQVLADPEFRTELLKFIKEELRKN